VADKWRFEAQRQSALKKTRERGTAAERIAVGRLYEEAHNLVVPAFMELSHRPDPPNEAEGLLLGIKDLILLWKIRHSKPRDGYHSNGTVFQGYVKRIVWDGKNPASYNF
jgi:hypothetical protein